MRLRGAAEARCGVPHLMFFGWCSGGSGSRSNNSSRLPLFSLCGYFFSSSAVVMPRDARKIHLAFCAVSASTVPSPMYSFGLGGDGVAWMASNRPSGDGLGVCTSSPPMMMSRKSSGKCWSSSPDAVVTEFGGYIRCGRLNLQGCQYRFGFAKSTVLTVMCVSASLYILF